jgi:hypothetical protein
MGLSDFTDMGGLGVTIAGFNARPAPWFPQVRTAKPRRMRRRGATI